ncbi:MAG: TetR/AcrR family transcriptional regulator [Deltaproteobacteria bacterium]|nr:TetR/AcrR family transcriptional regulator [Deltaproteobacteria bacterium]MBT4267465.1 TetR/AcrR family transcriptional regulator [Deltaproteobacteria bacterium]MBT4640722.1 TetR/AcrR family transcriptional regulator [Deltaproteobacteria bacterium]MBT6503690.1 TetR/AcrR family transcriptional regulator [Deltaproteobacteria bacterium]MBT6614968.1 TetR/AcrR family transcriptional regulator [Deltaproteobacteria bacterium]
MQKKSLGPKISPENRCRQKAGRQETREKILDAAIQVFARYPYQNAGLRVISKLAEVDHPLISYYFGSKADLFHAVLSRMMEQRLELQKGWFAVVRPMGAERGFSIFLDNLLEDYRKRPGLFHVVSLNLQQQIVFGALMRHGNIPKYSYQQSSYRSYSSSLEG